MYEDYANYTLNDARARLKIILDQQQSIQPLVPVNMLNNYEIFKTIDLPEIKKNMYMISNYGRVFNIKTQKQLSVVTRNISKSWYLYVGLQRVDNSRVILAIHNLVAIHFIPKTQEDIQLNRDIVNHINCIKNDPRVCNLEWVTIDDNNRYAKLMHEDSLFISPYTISSESNWGGRLCGEQNGMCRVPDNIVHKICECLSKGYSSRQCLEYCKMPITSNNMALIRSIRTRRRRVDISNNYTF